MMCGAIIVVAGTILFCINDNNEDVHKQIVGVKREKTLSEICNKLLSTEELASNKKSNTEEIQTISTMKECECNGAQDKQELFVDEDEFLIQSIYCATQQKMLNSEINSLATKQLIDYPNNEIVETVVEIKDNKTPTTTIIKALNENKNHQLYVFIQGYFDALQRMLNMKELYMQQTDSSTTLTAC